MSAIGLPAASAPRELSYCNVRVIGGFILSACLYNTAIVWIVRVDDSPTFLCSHESDYPFKIAWLGLPAGYVNTERKDVAIVGFTRSIDSLRVFLFLLEVENVNSIPSPSTGRFLFSFYVTAIYNY